MTPNADTITLLRTQYADCFGCGLDNPVGLRLDGFQVDGNQVTAPFSPADSFAGFEGVLHGGIIATALDEISAWSAMLTEGVFVFTARLELRYRKPADIGTEFMLTGTVSDRRGKRLSIEASLENDGAVIAESGGLFVAAQDVAELS